jgi:WD40 repeat protein/serine/threonine protein kinase
LPSVRTPLDERVSDLSNGTMTHDRPEDAPTIARLTGEWHAGTLTHGGDKTAPAPALPADAVPGYELLGEIGRGGMGVVYRARHVKLNRVVALKMVLAGPHARAVDLHRFRAEAESVAQLRHPNVVQVYDVGEANGLPFLSLELCAGSLADRLNGTPWPPKPAADLVETLARAVHAAHEAGILHRDLKPANVLLGDGVHGSYGTHESHGLIPKLTDFGLAKRLDGSGPGPTATGAVLGTPSYMAPEQAGRMTGQSKTITLGPTIDVYALGAILYELLTGRPPFLAASPLDTLLQVTRDDPVPPARLNPKTPRDLQTICLKCLEKEAGRRYPTAAALADDLRRYQSDEPITALPATRFERALKWTKRRPTQAALIAVSLTALIVLLAGGWYFTGQLAAERDLAMRAKNDAEVSAEAADVNAKKAEAEALKARQNNYVLAMGQAQLAWQSAAVDRLKNLLASQMPKPGENDLRGFEWHYWNHAIRGAPRSFRIDDSNPIVEALACSPDGKLLAAISRSGRAYLWDAGTGNVVRVIKIGDPWQAFDAARKKLPTLDGLGEFFPRCLTFRPDSRQFAVGVERCVVVFDVGTGAQVWRVESNNAATSLAYTPRGDRLVAWAGGQVHIHDAEKGGQIRVFARQNARGVVAVSPDGRRIAVASYPGHIHDADTGEELRELPAGEAAAYSPDGERLALVKEDAETGGVELRVVEVQTGRIVARAPAHSESGAAIAYSPAGNCIATAGRDHTVRLWEPATGREIRRFRGEDRWNVALAFSVDGRWLAVGNFHGVVEVWPIDFDQEGETVKAHKTLGTASLALDAATGRVLGCGVFGGMIDDPAAGKTIASLAGVNRLDFPSCSAFSADGKRVAIGFNDGNVRVWDTLSGKQSRELGVLQGCVSAVAFSADGRRLATACRSDLDEMGQVMKRAPGRVDRVYIWDLESAKIVCDISGTEVEQVNSIALTADGRRILTASGELIARLWDAQSGRLIHTLATGPGISHSGTAVALSPDGRWAAFAQSVGGSDGGNLIQLFDTASGEPAGKLEGHQRAIRKLAFRADSRRLASAGYDDTIRVWDVTTGQEVLSRPAPHNVVDLGFSRDGRRLTALASDGTLRTWSGE